MKIYKFIYAITCSLFLIFFTQGLTYAQSLSVFDVVNLLNLYTCKNCSCDEFGNCSCDNCTYDNVTLTKYVSGEDCKCTSCINPNDNVTDNNIIINNIFGNNTSGIDNNTSIDNLLDMTCQSCTCQCFQQFLFYGAYSMFPRICADDKSAENCQIHALLSVKH